MENTLVYFISDILLALGVILSIIAGFKIKDKSPKIHIYILNAILFAALLGFLPFSPEFLKLSNLQSLFSGFISFIPYEDYNLTLLQGSVLINPLSILFKFLITVSAFVVSIAAIPFIKILNRKTANFTTLFLLAVLSGFFICISNDFLSLFISIEILSTALCFMLASFNDKKNIINVEGTGALEASVKYFITGAISSCLMLLAMSYIYLHLGTLNFSDIETLSINKLLPQTPLLNIAEVFFFTAFAFKIGAYPFYIWVMDVFKGSNYSTGLFIATVVETAGITGFIKTVLVLGFFGSILNFALILCAVLTLVIGNMLAFRTVKKEGPIKDFLSASTIGNMGYIFLGISFLTKGSICAAIFYLIIYLIMNFGLWTGFMLIGKNLRKYEKRDTDIISSTRGLAYISPAFAAAFSVCLLSFAGFPVMAGFSAKFYLFVETLRTGVWAVYPLLFAAFASIIAVYYYFKIIYYMFLKPTDLKAFKKNAAFNKTNICTFILFISASLLFILFFFGAPLIEMLNNIV